MTNGVFSGLDSVLLCELPPRGHDDVLIPVIFLFEVVPREMSHDFSFGDLPQADVVILIASSVGVRNPIAVHLSQNVQYGQPHTYPFVWVDNSQRMGSAISAPLYSKVLDLIWTGGK